MDRENLINRQPLLNGVDNSSSDDSEEEYLRTDIRIPSHGDTNGQDQEETESIKSGHTTAHIPSDKYNFTYIVFYLLGISTLLPWNFFITAEDYWLYKFRNVTSTNMDALTPRQIEFQSDLSVASAVPSTIFLILNAFIGYRFPLKYRMIISLVVTLVLFGTTTAFVEIDTDKWQDKFFHLTLGIVVVINSATAILSGGLFGIAGLFSSEYITAVVSGQALGGIFASIAEIVSLTFGTSATTNAFIYFLVGTMVLFVALISYIVMSKTIFFKYCTTITQKTEKSLADLGRLEDKPNFRTVFVKIWMYCFSEWLVFVTTLSIYPAVTVLIHSQYKGNGHLWNDKYFVPVVNYLLFNSGDYLGRICAGLYEWPRNRPFVVAFLTVLRMLFVPTLLVCNTSGAHHSLPILITSDFIYIAVMCGFSFSNGYIANISLISAPKYVENGKL
jgi:solute carrier family 29 (equilibrative nucleoside transporter), member 1/2/3